MGFLQDSVRMLNKRELPLLKKYQESDSVYTFLFEKTPDLDWKAGQHGFFTITHKDIKKATRPFSVASAPAENVVRISVGISEAPSEFKRALLELEEGMKVNLRGPVGPMYIQDKSPLLLIAGGIGITPFRAILQQLRHRGENLAPQLTLLYLDSKGTFLYREELEELARALPLTLHYLHSREELYQSIDHFTSSYANQAKYFIAGPRLMVQSVTKHLKDRKIAKANIKKDPFLGYK